MQAVVYQTFLIFSFYEFIHANFRRKIRYYYKPKLCTNKNVWAGVFIKIVLLYLNCAIIRYQSQYARKLPRKKSYNLL